ncbi:MAG: hypothetical protein LBN95_10635 [Prevotellaceae bacterium]|jgi:hypothetical protein|nr:hypothetical protein [Prevotellaceae bacterium]
MYYKKLFLLALVSICFYSCFKNPTDGFKIAGSIENSEDCSHIVGVEAFAYNFQNNSAHKISESNYENNYFSFFLPNELKDKFCDVPNKWHLYDAKFEDKLTFSNKNVKIGTISIYSVNEEYNNDIQQFGYGTLFKNGILYVTFVKTKYIYAQSALSIKGDYETTIAGVEEGDFAPPKTMVFNLNLQKGWNTVYKVGVFSSPVSSYYWDIDTALVTVTTVKPENIELKWYYYQTNILRMIEKYDFYQPFVIDYAFDFIYNHYYIYF